MSLAKWIRAAGAVSAGALLYGMLVESNRLVLTRRRLSLPQWPTSFTGFKIALIGDLHIREQWSYNLACRAVLAAVDEDPDMVVLVGDYVGYWNPQVIPLLGKALEPLLIMNGNVVAIPGNHDYCNGDPEILEHLFDYLNIKLLRNEHWTHAGVTWVGVDSFNAGQAEPHRAFPTKRTKGPVIALWHEPDVVDQLPSGAHLMLSGHSHGGQFLTPWGTPFVGSTNGRRYRRGFYPDASTPLYVTSGVGTTGPPSRLFCPPEVAILEIHPA